MILELRLINKYKWKASRLKKVINSWLSSNSSNRKKVMYIIDFRKECAIDIVQCNQDGHLVKEVIGWIVDVVIELVEDQKYHSLEKHWC